MQVIFVIGPSCSGKTTLCSFLESKFGFKHVSLGKVLRTNETHKVCLIRSHKLF